MFSQERKLLERDHGSHCMVEDVDTQIGRLLAALRQAGQEENTIVIFTSDHGDGQGAHQWTGKMMFYEEEAAVPLIVSWKGVTPAGRIDREHLVSTLDVLPTICDYAGVRPPPVMRGHSLRGVIEKPEQRGAECVVSEMASWGGTRSFMVRTRQYKYMIFSRPGAERVELLFDLAADPGEKQNLAGQSSLSAELERHRALLDQWKQTTEEGKYPVGSVKNKKAIRRKAKV